MHPRMFRTLFAELEEHMESRQDNSKGYFCNRRFLHGMELESSVWCAEQYAYYFDKKGKMHSLTVDYEKGVVCGF